MVTIGQYLQANRQKLLVKSFVPPEHLKNMKNLGIRIGLSYLYCRTFCTIEL